MDVHFIELFGMDSGHRNFGENYVQEFCDKAPKVRKISRITYFPFLANLVRIKSLHPLSISDVGPWPYTENI
jgi:uncharacterized pyridoxal phosphate-containing UPF0001 family protein